MNRIERQKQTVELMIDIYCKAHKPQADKCQELKEYAKSRLSNCKFANDKPTCEHCPIHCYKPEMRELIRQVMRYSGPRMLFRHPILTLQHLLEK